MSAPNIQIDDLILYFESDKDGPVYRLIPEDVYKNERLRLDDLDEHAPNWQGSILSEVNPNTADEYYVANMSRLIDPSTPGFTHAPSGIEVDELDVAGPGAKDLIIIPYDDADHGYLITRDLYQNTLPPIAREDIPDVDFMATEEGVIVANIRKFEQTGICCYLLNLTGLRRPESKSPTRNAGKRASRSAKKASSKR